MSEEKCCKKCGQVIEPEKCDECKQPVVSEPDYLPTKVVVEYAALALLVVIIVAFVPFIFYGGYPAEVNNFGDSFGFANALVSACAFAALIMTMFWQKQELEQQRHEIRQMREASQESADAQRDSHEALRQASRLSALAELRESAEKLVDTETGDAISNIQAMLIRNRVETEILGEFDDIHTISSRDIPYEKQIYSLLNGIINLRMRRYEIESEAGRGIDDDNLPESLVWKQAEEIQKECKSIMEELPVGSSAKSEVSDVYAKCTRRYSGETGLEPFRIYEAIEKLSQIATHEVRMYRPLNAFGFASGERFV